MMVASTKAPTTTKGARVSISLARFGLQHLGALAVKIGPHPGMLGLKKFMHRSDGDDLAVGQRRNAITLGIHAGEIMGHHEHRQAQRSLQGLDQRVEIAGSDRIKARGRLGEKNDRRIERPRAGQRHTLGHAARQLGGKLVGVLRRQADHFKLGDRDLVHQRLRQRQIFAQRELDILPHGKRRKQRALLEQDAPSPGGALVAAIPGSPDSGAQDLDLAASPRNEPDNGSHQYRPAAAGSTDQAEDLAPADVERQMVDPDLPAEADHQILDADRELRSRLLHRHIPIDAKNTANSPSSTITRKIDFTTDVVVCLPSDSALPFTRRPSLQATMPIANAMNGALMLPTLNVVNETASCRRAM